MAACRQEWAVSEVTGLTLLRAALVGYSLPSLTALCSWALALAVCILGLQSPVLKIRLRPSLASELETSSRITQCFRFSSSGVSSIGFPPAPLPQVLERSSYVAQQALNSLPPAFISQVLGLRM